jgi:hypothetical protein
MRYRMKWWKPCTSVLLVSMLALTVQAQDSAQSPTPAPSKTPTPAAQVPVGADEAAFEPLTQADLQVLTGNVQRPNGIAFFNEFLYIACTGDQTIYETHSQTGQTRTYIWGLENAHMLYVEGDAASPVVWAPDYLDNSLKRVVRGVGAEVMARGLQGPWGLAALDDERFLVSNMLGDNIVLVTREGEVTPFVGDMADPTGLAIGDGVVYVANSGSTRRSIEWYDLEVPGTRDGALLLGGLQNVTGLQLAADGKLYFAYALGTRGMVGRVQPEACMEKGGCANTDVEIVLYTELETPLAGLTMTPDMRLFVHTMFQPSIYWAQLPVQAGG